LALVVIAGALSIPAGCARDPQEGDPSVTGPNKPNVTPPPEPMFANAAGKIETTPVVCAAPAEAGAITFEKIAAWRDDADAAYAMVHDDLCGPELRGIDKVALPALEMRNLKATLGPFVKICEDYRLWDMVRAAQARGHEIGNHSFTHATVRPANAKVEIADAKRALDAQLMSPVLFYIFPYDDFSDATIEMARAAGHIGARAGNRDDNDGFDSPPINGREARNDMTLEFDAWPRAYSKYASFKESDILDLHVHNAIEKQGFALREFHSVTTREVAPLAGEGFGPVPLRTYERHLDFLYYAWRANKVWTSTVSDVIRYRRARQSCTASVEDNVIRFVANAGDCRNYATPISVVVRTAVDLPGLSAMQGTSPVFVRKLEPSRFSVTADPGGGDVQLSGCETAVSTVDPTIVLPPKPTPAQSVCDLETVAGTGTQGRMDNFERDAASLQILPNPGQADGRNGSWSWHPTNTMARIVPEGRGHVLQYTGMRPGRWSGVTLAFLGGNGAGTCYDARAYSGIRFKVKGSIQTPDNALNSGKVIVSLISAETQSQRFGGDLKGEGGHFYAAVEVTPNWTVVSIPFTDFRQPTWGVTANLMQAALSKLQAIDWGSTDGSAIFELYFDDVELY
jgi:peptidoglycan/xylan/chitin deacetylase (PgdA/CDA1 family)